MVSYFVEIYAIQLTVSLDRGKLDSNEWPSLHSAMGFLAVPLFCQELMDEHATNFLSIEKKLPTPHAPCNRFSALRPSLILPVAETNDCNSPELQDEYVLFAYLVHPVPVSPLYPNFD